MSAKVIPDLARPSSPVPRADDEGAHPGFLEASVFGRDLIENWLLVNEPGQITIDQFSIFNFHHAEAHQPDLASTRQVSPPRRASGKSGRALPGDVSGQILCFRGMADAHGGGECAVITFFAGPDG
jgi:hypothetical protein